MIRAPVLAIALVGAALLAGCGTLKTTADALDLLKRCTSKQGPLDGYCGTIEVWENYKAQTGRRIPLNVVVLPGARRGENPDPLFYLAGGPGQAAAKEAAEIQQAFQPVLADRDIVLVDQRGTGGSNSLACDSKEDAPLKADPEAAVRLLPSGDGSQRGAGQRRSSGHDPASVLRPWQPRRLRSVCRCLRGRSRLRSSFPEPGGSLRDAAG